MARFNVGDKVHYLTIIEKIGSRKDKHFVTKCECGTIKKFRYSAFYSRRPAKSCGCKTIELLRNARTIHGHGDTSHSNHSRTYQSWMSMKERCDDPNHKSYLQYGGRGIYYCSRWSNFVEFLADMGKRPEGKTLGRIDNDGIYEPTNCEWQTHKEQARNRRSSRYLSFDNKNYCLSQWAEYLGCSDDVLQKRLDNGWSIERTLTTTVRPMLPRGQTKRGSIYSKYQKPLGIPYG